MVRGIIGMGGGSLTNELLDMSEYSPEAASTSAFVQQRVKIKPEAFETVLTNLDGQIYPPQKLKELYAGRWGIETSFRDLKYTLGMLHFHSKNLFYHFSHGIDFYISINLMTFLVGMPIFRFFYNDLTIVMSL